VRSGFVGLSKTDRLNLKFLKIREIVRVIAPLAGSDVCIMMAWNTLSLDLCVWCYSFSNDRTEA
jgi:hypothetical protein